MTSFNPRLSVRRLLVKRGSADAYDANFHDGLNIIAGENSSGKSTVLDFLFYGLGGDLTDWREAALACTELFLEVELNGEPAVLAREISEQSGRPMRVYFGSLSQAQNNATGWGIYPYRRSENKESFSQVLFRLLGMPEATGDANSNITMHQLLRILYADQLSPVDRIFRFERFDTALTRQTVGDLLCGGYDNLLYRAQLRLRDAEKELAGVTAEWRSALAVFAGAEHAVTGDWIDAQRAVIRQELDQTRAEAAELEQQIFNAEVSDGLTLEQQKAAYHDLVEAQSSLLGSRQQKDAIQLEITDSASFIAGLRTKLDQLRDAESVSSEIDGISFLYCPSCLAPIEDAGDHACSLCKSPFDRDRARSRILAIINETGLQIRQSESLQADRYKDLERLELEISELTRRWSSFEERYRLLNRLPSTELRARARELYGRAGYLERQLEDLSEKATLIERVEALSRAKRDLNAEILDLKEKIEASERHQVEQLARAYTIISKSAVEFLRQDLDRQDIFHEAQSVNFSFGDDRLAVNGESFFSASSMVYLRNSFFAAFLKASLIDPKFRYPRFLMLDTIEDKGMEPERSHRFQNLLAKMSSETEVDHQIIYATAMISPQLANSGLIVDRFYTHDNRTLGLL